MPEASSWDVLLTDFYFHVNRVITIMNVRRSLSPGDVSDEPVTLEKRKNGWRMRCDVGEATEGLENEL